jgi:hypothetical protein
MPSLLQLLYMRPPVHRDGLLYQMPGHRHPQRPDQVQTAERKRHGQQQGLDPGSLQWGRQRHPGQQQGETVRRQLAPAQQLFQILLDYLRALWLPLGPPGQTHSPQPRMVEMALQRPPGLNEDENEIPHVMKNIELLLSLYCCLSIKCVVFHSNQSKRPQGIKR